MSSNEEEKKLLSNNLPLTIIITVASVGLVASLLINQYFQKKEEYLAKQVETNNLEINNEEAKNIDLLNQCEDEAREENLQSIEIVNNWKETRLSEVKQEFSYQEAQKQLNILVKNCDEYQNTIEQADKKYKNIQKDDINPSEVFSDYQTFNLSAGESCSQELQSRYLKIMSDILNSVTVEADNEIEKINKNLEDELDRCAIKYNFYTK